MWKMEIYFSKFSPFTIHSTKCKVLRRSAEYHSTKCRVLRRSAENHSAKCRVQSVA